MAYEWTDQWNKIKSPEIELSTYGIECIIKVAFQITEAQVNLTVIRVGKKRKLDLFLNPYITINPKWIRKLNIQNKPIQISEENIGEFLYKLGIGKYFLTENPDATNKKLTNLTT